MPSLNDVITVEPIITAITEIDVNLVTTHHKKSDNMNDNKNDKYDRHPLAVRHVRHKTLINTTNAVMPLLHRMDQGHHQIGVTTAAGSPFTRKYHAETLGITSIESKLKNNRPTPELTPGRRNWRI